MTATATPPVSSDSRRSPRLRLAVAGAIATAGAIIAAGGSVTGAVLSSLGVDIDGLWGGAVHFWLYESAKILALIALITFVVGLAGTWLTPDRVQKMLTGRRAGTGHVLAAGLGVATPFCSCSSVPLYLGLSRAGVPVGVGLTFLVASPLVDGVALALLAGLAGWHVAALYLVVGVTLAMATGLIVGRVAPPSSPPPRMLALAMEQPRPTLDDRLRAGVKEARTTTRKLWPYVLVAIAIGAAVHGWVPTDMLASAGGAWWGVPVAALVAIPLYSGTATAVPLVAPLFAAGVPLGTLIAFLMGVVALSVPELVMLRKAMPLRLLATFVGVVTLGIVAVGYLINAVT